MAEFYAPPIVAPPDILGQYIRGQAAAQQTAMMPLQLQQAQQEVQRGALSLDQLRMMVGNQQLLSDFARQQYGQTGAEPSQQAGSAQSGAQSPVGASGGIQNGPQQTVTGPMRTGPTQASGSYDGSVGASPLDALMDPRRIAAGAVVGSIGAMFNGGDPNKPLAEAQQMMQARLTDAQQRAKLALAPAVDQVTALTSSSHPEQLLLANPQYKAIWDQYAGRLGLNPNDPQSLTPANVRSAATMFYNENIAARSLGAYPAMQMPQTSDVVQGLYGQILSRKPVSGEISQVAPAHTPTYDVQKVWDPVSQTYTARQIQTGGWPQGGSGAPGPTNLGMQAPSDEQRKAAELADYMRSGLQGISKLEQRGYTLSPTARALIMNAATSEDSSFFPQWWAQESANHGLTKNDQTYMAALMPMLQAAGHSLAGARLTLGQVRQNFESLVPIDLTNAEANQQIAQNRLKYYRGLIGEAGTAMYLPEFRDVAEDYNRLAGITKTIGGVTYHKQNGKWYAD